MDSETYSLTEISKFTGNDADALKLIVDTFVATTLDTIAEINELIPQKDIEAIAARAHKLLPTFRQFNIVDVIDDLEKLERYKETELPANEFLKIAQRVCEMTIPIIEQIKKDAN